MFLGVIHVARVAWLLTNARYLVASGTHTTCCSVLFLSSEQI